MAYININIKGHTIFKDARHRRPLYRSSGSEMKISKKKWYAKITIT